MPLSLKSFPRVTKAQHMRPVMMVAVISTQHLTKADGAQLALNDPRDVLAEVERGHGHIIHFQSRHEAHFVCADDFADDYAPELFSDHFRLIVFTFASLGYSYLRFDPDHEPLPDFPTFQW